MALERLEGQGQHHGSADAGHRPEERGEGEDGHKGQQVEDKVLGCALVVAHEEVDDEGVEQRLEDRPRDLGQAAAAKSRVQVTGFGTRCVARR